MPSSSLVEVGVEVEVEVEVGVGGGSGLGLCLPFLLFLTFSGGWWVGWLEKLEIKLSQLKL